MFETLPPPLLKAGRMLYRQALCAAYSRRGLPWIVHGEVIRIDPRLRHLVPHESEPGLADLIRRQVVPGDVVLDVGAFLGIYAIVAARRAGPAGRVVAFEPTAWSARAARRHFAYNDLSVPRVQLVEAAVSDAPGRATLHEYPTPYMNSLAMAADSSVAGTCRDVDVVTIDDTCRELGIVPTFMRMDVQGAECHALRGARDTIRAAPDHLTIVVEMHPQCWPAFGVDERAMAATIADLDLTARPLLPGSALYERDGHAVLTKRRSNRR